MQQAPATHPGPCGIIVPRAVLLTALALPWLAATSLAAPASLGLPLASPADAGLSPEKLGRVTSALESYVDSGKLPGVVAMIARHGKLGYARAVGYADVEHRTPLSTGDVFRIYSLTKPVIAVAVLELAERGKLRLDDPVAKYIPAFGDTKVFAGGSAAMPVLRAPDRPITIAHLLTQTAGLTYGLFGHTPVDSMYLEARPLDFTRPLDEAVDSLARLPLMSSPGDAWNYGAAYDVLGRVIEIVTGEKLDVALDRLVFRPLGMTSTRFHASPELMKRIPVLYTRSTDSLLVPVRPPLEIRYRSEGRLLSGGAGLLSSPSDYLRFAQMLLNGGELDGHRILERGSVTEITRNQLPPALTPIDAPIVAYSGYGYGFGGTVLVDSTRSGLPGSPGIYRWWGLMGTFFWIDPRADLIGMVWTQFAPGRAFPLEQDFQRMVYEAVEP